jgi:hypothetical protein
MADLMAFSVVQGIMRQTWQSKLFSTMKGLGAHKSTLKVSL